MVLKKVKKDKGQTKYEKLVNAPTFYLVRGQA